MTTSRVLVVAMTFAAVVLPSSRPLAHRPQPPEPPAIRELVGGTYGMEWRAFLAIQAAAKEASRQKRYLEACRIHVFELKDLLVVSFTNSTTSLDPAPSLAPAPSLRHRGCAPGPCPCWEAELAKTDLRVVRAYFTR
ncbi:MAG TPA: hypothetical protein VEB43_01815 [Anaeromyxobacter sp.]|nr:hypothetical protein [Anaeromyxobacter sp.]